MDLELLIWLNDLRRLGLPLEYKVWFVNVIKDDTRLKSLLLNTWSKFKQESKSWTPAWFRLKINTSIKLLNN